MIRSQVLVCGGTGCTSSGSKTLISTFEEELVKYGLQDEVKIVPTGCFGLCEKGPVVIVYPEGTCYSHGKKDDVPKIVYEKLLKLNVKLPTSKQLVDKVLQKFRHEGKLVYRENDEGTVMATYAQAALPSRVHAFEREMANAFASADVVVARAGASTCFEIALCGKPALLIPLPSALRNHQHVNADAFAQKGAADEGIQSELSPRQLVAANVRNDSDSVDALDALLLLRYSLGLVESF